MKPEELSRLRDLSAKERALTAITVRLDRRVVQEIEDFCAKNPSVRRSVLLRDCLERGWAGYKEGDDPESS